MSSLRAYIVVRVALTIPMVLILLTVVFLILRVMPGDPASAVLGAHAPPEQIELVRQQLGLNKPLFLNLRGSTATVLPDRLELHREASADSEVVAEVMQGQVLEIVNWSDDRQWVELFISEISRIGWAPKETVEITVRPFDSQYFNYLFDLVRLDLGTSAAPPRKPVIEWIKDKFPATLELSLTAIVIAMVVGLFGGAFAARRRKSAGDYALRIFGMVVYSIPVFWLGLMLLFFFGDIFGVSGRASTGMEPARITGLYVLDSLLTGNWASLGDSLKHLVLPSLTLGLVFSGIFIRLTRANMLDVLQQDYILAARARGIPEGRVIYGHALKNAFIPILTMMGLQFALLLAGAVLTETTFSWQGMGLFLANRIQARDFPAVQGTVVFFALLVTAVSLLVDILYAFLDPRIRY